LSPFAHTRSCEAPEEPIAAPTIPQSRLFKLLSGAHRAKALVVDVSIIRQHRELLHRSTSVVDDPVKHQAEKLTVENSSRKSMPRNDFASAKAVDTAPTNDTRVAKRLKVEKRQEEEHKGNPLLQPSGEAGVTMQRPDESRGRRRNSTPGSQVGERIEWIQCDACQKWRIVRRLPKDTTYWKCSFIENLDCSVVDDVERYGENGERFP
jgi:hypothetical protein